MSPAPRLEVEGIYKRFSGVLALSNVGLSVAPGEVHAVVGENGAGKSTLMMILSGIRRPDAGCVRIDGAPTVIRDAAHAHSLGIGTVFQELSLMPSLSVVENILPNRLPTRLGFVRKREAQERVLSLLGRLGIELDPWAAVDTLPIASRQLVEVAKALSQAGRILILDEPTSSLTPVESDRLFSVVRGFAEAGGSVLYVSHKLSEVFAISDMITVLRDGCKVGSTRAADATPEQIVSMMVGRAVKGFQRQAGGPAGQVVLSVRGVSSGKRVRDVSFDVRKGEIVGLAGVQGAGRSETARVIFGLDRADSGTIEVEGRSVRPRSPHDAMASGIAYVPEDRKEDGLFLQMSIWQNMIAARLPEVARHGMLNDSLARAKANVYKEKMRIRAEHLDVPVDSLSGGNQQKVLISKWLVAGARVLIVDEPTRGVDVGARAEIHDLLQSFAGEGAGVVVISSDLPELLAICDRICVMREGALVRELSAAEASEEKIVACATGVGN